MEHHWALNVVSNLVQLLHVSQIGCLLAGIATGFVHTAAVVAVHVAAVVIWTAVSHLLVYVSAQAHACPSHLSRAKTTLSWLSVAGKSLERMK